jgi:beta-glucanase (GH16 family)
MKNLFMLLSILLILAACQKDNYIPKDIVLPSNLQVTLDINSATVDVTAHADSANFYIFTFYENGDSTMIKSNAGVATHTYSTSGEYSVKTVAYTTAEHFITETDAFEINLNMGGTGAPTSGPTSPMSYNGYTLVWHDEFNGATLSNDWVYDIGTGNGGWGNNELQYYTNQNATVSGGVLQITAKQEAMGGQNYTSSRIKTQGVQSWKYGRIDIRAALPKGQGIWPALWMLGDNITSVSWPACGEIDIMEMIGGAGNNDKTVHGTAHWSDNGSHAQYGDSYTLNSGIFADEFHVFSIVWNANSITWLVDNTVYNTMSTTPAQLAEFQEKFFFIFNVAVGGNWPGSPDATTQLPQTMYVDYVRVFQ